MLRWVIIGYGVLCLIVAVVLFLAFHASTSLALYLAVNGVIIVGALLFERKRYHSRVDRTRGHWQPTDERFVDPASGRLMQVYYNAATGERDYREAPQ